MLARVQDLMDWKRVSSLFRFEKEYINKWLMTLPQVHYHLAKPTQHKPRQWIGSMGMKCAQALRKYITINTGK